jgi:hypothetical protein
MEPETGQEARDILLIVDQSDHKKDKTKQKGICFKRE